MMKYIEIFTKLIPFIIELVKLVEAAFATVGKGAEKKAAVLEGVEAALPAEEFATLKPAISAGIDVFASSLFPKDGAA